VFNETLTSSLPKLLDLKNSLMEHFDTLGEHPVKRYWSTLSQLMSFASRELLK